MGDWRTVSHVCRIEFERRLDTVRIIAIAIVISLLVAFQVVILAISGRGLQTGDYYVIIEWYLRYTIPFVAVAFSYRTFAAERETGTLRVLLSAPYTRTEILLGKYFGCLSVSLLPIGVIVVVAFALSTYFGGIEPVLTASMVVLTGLFVAALVAVAVCCSLRSVRGRRALVDGLVIFAGMLVVWPIVLTTAAAFLEGSSVAWLLDVIRVFVPMSAYEHLVTALATPGASAAPLGTSSLAVVSLIVWTCGPVVFADRTLDQADL